MELVKCTQDFDYVGAGRVYEITRWPNDGCKLWDRARDCGTILSRWQLANATERGWLVAA